MLIKEINKYMENYELHKAARLFPEFVDNLSNWYIRRSRKRFWKSESDEDKNQAYQTLHFVLIELSKLLAPFAPFVAEEIYENLAVVQDVQNVQAVENVQNDFEKEYNRTIKTARTSEAIEHLSVHLADYPQADEELIDEKLNKQMNEVREIVNQGLQLRSKTGIKVRQPLQVLSIKYKVSSMELADIIKEELNVKEIKVNSSQGENVTLDTKITEDLRLEGQAREIIRCIQQMRKEAGYEVDNRIEICYSGMSEVFKKFGDMIAKETLAEKISSRFTVHGSRFDLEKEFEIGKDKIKIRIRKK
jgi:isoleucyl-tRNA synthetase